MEPKLLDFLQPRADHYDNGLDSAQALRAQSSSLSERHKNAVSKRIHPGKPATGNGPSPCILYGCIGMFSPSFRKSVFSPRCQRIISILFCGKFSHLHVHKGTLLTATLNLTTACCLWKK